jgi:hypothetical protein
MKKSVPDLPPSHKATLPPQHGQTESTAGRDQVREEMHHTSAPHESKRPNERTSNHKKK